MNDRDCWGILLLQAETLALALQPFHGRAMFQGPYEALKEVIEGEVVLGIPEQREKESLGELIRGPGVSPLVMAYDPAQDPFVALLKELPQDRKGPWVFVTGTLPFLKAQTLQEILKRHSGGNTFASVLIVGGPQEDSNPALRFGGIVLGDFAPLPEASSLKELLSTWESEGRSIEYVKLEPPDGVEVSDGEEFLQAFDQAALWRLDSLIREGIILEDPRSLLIDTQVVVQKGVRLGRGVVLQGLTKVEEGAQIGAYSVLKDVTVHSGALVLSHSVLESCEVGEGARVGPFSRIRPESILGKGVSVGNFVELKKADLKEGVKANHLSYLGDCEVGAFSNVGAGVITCNFDGTQKHHTKVGQGVFIGSDCQLIAPLEVGDGAYIGAGSTITRDIPPKALAVRRAKMRLVANWAGSKKDRKKD